MVTRLGYAVASIACLVFVLALLWWASANEPIFPPDLRVVCPVVFAVPLGFYGVHAAIRAMFGGNNG